VVNANRILLLWYAIPPPFFCFASLPSSFILSLFLLSLLSFSFTHPAVSAYFNEKETFWDLPLAFADDKTKQG
jgi:hypothetical protein